MVNKNKSFLARVKKKIWDLQSCLNRRARKLSETYYLLLVSDWGSTVNSRLFKDNFWE